MNPTPTTGDPPDGALAAALVERFDREPGEYGRRHYWHYMSAQTLLEARKGDARFYTDIADGLRAVCRTDTEALTELAELHLRILFTILVSNNDDHLKNHGLLYAGEGNWALAPAQFLVGERFDRGPMQRVRPSLRA